MTQVNEDRQRMEQCRGWMQETTNGVVYDWGLAGSGGAWFTLFREAKHTTEDMKIAQRHLRNERDVVSLCIRRV